MAGTFNLVPDTVTRFLNETIPDNLLLIYLSLGGFLILGLLRAVYSGM